MHQLFEAQTNIDTQYVTINRLRERLSTVRDSSDFKTQGVRHKGFRRLKISLSTAVRSFNKSFDLLTSCKAEISGEMKIFKRTVVDPIANPPETAITTKKITVEKKPPTKNRGKRKKGKKKGKKSKNSKPKKGPKVPQGAKAKKPT